MSGNMMAPRQVQGRFSESPEGDKRGRNRPPRSSECRFEWFHQKADLQLQAEHSE